MALAGIKLDDERGSFVSNCFPVRSALGKFCSEASGKWLEVQQIEQNRRLKSLLTSKPLTYARIKEERKKTEKQGVKLESQAFENEEEEKDGKILDGFFLMQHCCVDDPSDLCSINILNKELTDVKEEDLAMFDNVAYINAGENYLPLEAFRGFPSLRELELPLNGVRSLHISHSDFIHLEMLDLSYNNLSQNDILTLGFLRNLKILHLTGNNFSQLPTELALPFISQDKKLFIPRFTNLEVLLLDNNKLKEISIFAALAGLPKLVHLDLSKNEIFFVPQLKSVEGKLVTQDSSAKQKSSKKSSRKSSRHSARKEKSEISGSTDSTDSKLDENKESNIQDLMSEDFMTGDLPSKLDDLDLGTENSDLSAYNQSKELQKAPFPELRYLNLANNKICEEEGILALAAWPMLSELDIYNNPLTTETSGDPPLLKRFLQDRLGIKLNRKKPEKQLVPGNKKRGKIHPKAIKVTDQVPKVPKVSVENKMLMFAGHSMKAITEGKSVLPPIATEPRDEETDKFFSSEDLDGEVIDDNDPSETFFMTQLDDVDKHGGKDHVRSSDTAATFHSKFIPRPPEEGAPEKIDDKYRGYELLLDVGDLEDDSDLPPSSDVQGNVRALKHTLNHLLVYRDPSVNLNKVQMLVPVHRKKVQSTQPVQSYQEKIDDVLNNLKNRKTYEEEELSEVLKDKNLIKEKFPEAENLIGQIQRRYNAVRVHSLRQAKSAQQLSHSVKQLVTKSGLQTINTGGEKN